MDTSKLTFENLHINYDDPIEYQKILIASETIFNKAKNNESLTEVEKEILCRQLQYSHGSQPPFDVAAVCANYNFKFLYLVYFKDLTGGSVYLKPGNIQVPVSVAQTELAYLKDAANIWQNLINQPGVSHELIVQSKKEADFAIEGLKKSPDFANGIAFGGSNRFQYKKMAIYLHSKFIYLLAKEIFESFDPNDLRLNIDGKVIVINEYSIIHIVSRHYAEIIKQYDTGKSYHKIEFQPRILNKKLKEIFNLIDIAGGLNQHYLNSINFMYKGQIYRAYTTDSKNNTDTIKLSTFFPVDNLVILEELKNKYHLVNINSDLSFYRAH